MLKNDVPDEPKNYSMALVEKIFNEYNKKPKLVNLNEPPNVIIFFIEAFSDPMKIGLETSYDVIPNFRKLSEQHTSGSVFSPVLGGRSANAEFELLTGLSMRFVTKGSIPYIDILNHEYLRLH